MSDASRPAKRARRTATTKTTTTPTARLSSQAAARLTSAAADDAPPPDFHHPYVPSRAIPPIAPTPPSQCPLPRARATLVSRQYDLASGQPLYRVRVEPRRPTPPRHGPASPRSPSPRDEPRREEGESQDNGAARELDVWLDDVLEYVSAAELERFELGYEDDVVVVVDEDGAVLLVSKEARRAMAGLPPVGAEVPRAGEVPGKVRRRKAPTREFVDALPVVKRGRGRPRKTAAVMGVVAESDGKAESVGADTAEGEETAAEVGTATDTKVEGIDYGAWVDPARVRGTGSIAADAMKARTDMGERDEMAPSETSEYLGRYRAGGVMLSKEEAPAASGGKAPSSRRGTKTRGSTRGFSRAGATRGSNGRPARTAAAREASITSSVPSFQVRESRSSKGARLRRSSISSNGSAAESFHSAISWARSTRSTTAPISRPRSQASSENGAAGLLTTFRSTQASQRQAEKEGKLFISPNATPKASQQTKSSQNQDTRRRTSTSALHQASSMLHPPSESLSWEPESEEGDEYEIESVFEHKEFAGDTYYLIKWAHYPLDNESWFTAEELEDAREVLDEYLAGLKRGEKGKGRAVAPDQNGDVGGLDGTMDDDSEFQNEDMEVDMVR